MIRLFVGLGNPGPEYEATRHNAGFWWLDALASQLGTRLVSDRAYQGHVARMAGPQGPVWLLKPMTFMNRSGLSVATLARFFKIEPAQVLVVHDELDLEPGQAKLKFGGSAAGHNGLKDIHALLGTPDYWRLRLGIGHPGDRAEVVNYVLKKPSAEHRELIAKTVERTLKASDLLMAGTMDAALTLIHAQPPRPKPPRAVPPAEAAVKTTPAPPAAAAPATPTPGTAEKQGDPP